MAIQNISRTILVWTKIVCVLWFRTSQTGLLMCILLNILMLEKRSVPVDKPVAKSKKEVLLISQSSEASLSLTYYKLKVPAHLLPTKLEACLELPDQIRWTEADSSMAWCANSGKNFCFSFKLLKTKKRVFKSREDKKQIRPSPWKPTLCAYTGYIETISRQQKRVSDTEYRCSEF